MIRNNRGAHFIAFYSNDKELLEKIRNLLGSNHKLAPKKRNKFYKNRKQSYQLQIGSKEIFNDLINLGMTPNKSLILEMPNMPEELLGHFLRGHFDGDGCVYFRKNWAKDRNKLRWVFQVRFTSGSKQFLEGLHSSLKSIKICKGGYLYEKNRAYELIFSHNDGFALFRLMYDNISSDIYLERKYKIFQKASLVLNMRA